ncbi:hypothetical protein RQP53_10860 [Paucibacter sp. APW11]|uniref:C-type lectin domain-containing protein n=1 Tax=Roseateles aquae TaxID=3077235 RepID=A0ABU3PB26_9BURK|nr:hypothetical protein [Paucibacter sp. APW11]MDT8999768.1 hypothetical protein [Paucibacter sp. APW11]
MFTTPPLLTTSLSLCALGLVLALLTVDSRPPSLRPTEAAWQAALMAAVGEHLAKDPEAASSCGVLRLASKAPELSAATSCVEAARHAGAAFWVLSEAQGEDSRVWLLLRGESGNLHEVSFDSHGWEQRGQPSFSSAAVDCVGYRLGQPLKDGDLKLHEPAFVCVRA